MIAVNRLEPHLNGTGKHSPPEESKPPALASDLSAHPAIEMSLLRLFADHEKLLRPLESHSIQAGDLVLRLSIEHPTDAPPAPETECERNVLDAVRELVERHNRRVTTKEILSHLDETSRIWGKSTIQNALASFCHRGLLVNLRDKRGYGFPQLQKGGEQCAT